MTITNTPSLTPLNKSGATGPARASRRASGFTLREPPVEDEVAASASPEPVTLGGLLAAQEFGPENPRDRAARRHGQRMLELLRRMQRAFLDAGNTAALGMSPDLIQLASLAESIPEADNPHLALILRGVAVRAAVEIARRDMTQSAQMDRSSMQT